ncbi:unnamed protein product [Tuber aestivum]|uniref:Uncharacterized protein n=1 Tax=Tuber aestivum TaxID=59557 RepID=A0A292PZZ4_9PEZI|nr:unnamed protein product [Tuber aestivum]
MADKLAHEAELPPTASSSKKPESNQSVDIGYYLNEGLEGTERQQYHDVPSFARAIKSQADHLRAGNLIVGQYAVFSSVTSEELTKLEQNRDTNRKSLRFLYLNDVETLIVKITPSKPYELSTSDLVQMVHEKAIAMGLVRQLLDLRGATFQGVRSKKEGDSALIPRTLSLATDWPTVIFECGLSESLKRLRADASWWLENSRGAVKIVLLICVSPQQRKIHLEQWETRNILNPQPSRTDNSPLVTRRRKVHEIDITAPIVTGSALSPPVVDGAPLTLDFEKVMLRQPGNGEGNVVLTAQDLADYATIVWRSAQ